MEPNLTPQDYLYTLAASPNFEQDGILFAAKRSGLFKSTDRGLTWESAYTSLNLDAPLPTTQVAFSPGFATDQTVFAGVEGNLLRSKDGGQTWETAQLSVPPPVVSSLVLSSNFPADGILLAGTMEDGVYRTVNRGVSYTGWNFGLLDRNINALVLSPDFATDQTILAGTEIGVFRSTNGGRTWRDVDFPMDLAPVLSLVLTPTGEIIAGTEDNGLFKSTDNGDTWDALTPDEIEGAVDQIILDGPSGLLIVQDDSVFVSKDGGQSWEQKTGFAENTLISSVTTPLGLNPGASLFIGLSDGQILSLPLNP